MLTEINMIQLRVGDLFTFKIEGKDRKSYTVNEILEKYIIVTETVDPDWIHAKKNLPIKKQIKGYVYLLKRRV